MAAACVWPATFGTVDVAGGAVYWPTTILTRLPLATVLPAGGDWESTRPSWDRSLVARWRALMARPARPMAAAAAAWASPTTFGTVTFVRTPTVIATGRPMSLFVPAAGDCAMTLPTWLLGGSSETR